MWLILLIISVIKVISCDNEITLPPFRQILNDIQSEPIEVINDDTLLITNFYFDGLSPNATFAIGRGQPSEENIPIPYSENFTTLPAINNGNITLKLPNLTISDIDYLAIWREDLNTSAGHVFMNERWIYGLDKPGMIVPKTISSFKKTNHNVSSENIELLNEKTIIIPNFNYNGKNKIQFWVGKGSLTSIHSNGMVAFIQNGTNFLSTCSNKNITIILPNGHTLADFDYLTVYDVEKKINYGHVYFTYTSDDIKKYIGKQLGRLNNLEYGLKSGPIILTDENTLYITDFHYKGFGNEYFRAGIVQNKSEYFFILNQRGGNESIITDNGSSFYLELPEIIETEGNEVIYFFGIWDNEKKELIGKIEFNRNRGQESEKISSKITPDGRKIIRIPKCCDFGQMISGDKCVQTDLNLDNSISVCIANSTDFNDAPMANDRIILVPFRNELSCPKIMLDPNFEEDAFIYFTNGLLWLISTNENYTQEEFCFDIINEDGTIYRTAFICTHEYKPIDYWILAIALGVCASLISLCVTVGILCVVTKKSDLEGIILVTFVLFMAMGFLCLVITQIKLDLEKLCYYFSLFYQCFIVSSILCLHVFSYELYYHIKNYNNYILTIFTKRTLIYLIIVVGVPLLFLVLSSIISYKSGLISENFDNNCFSGEWEGKWLFYSTILITIIIAIIETLYIIYFYYKTNLVNGGNNWDNSTPNIKTRLIQLTILILFIGSCWIIEIISYALKSHLDFMDFIHVLQGLFTAFIIVFIQFFDMFKRTVIDIIRKIRNFFGNQRENQQNEKSGIELDNFM